jgi:hypothetical protein
MRDYNETNDVAAWKCQFGDGVCALCEGRGAGA